jgi:hypothetical protein
MLKMSKEQQELLDVAHKNYVDQTMFTSDPTWLKPIPCMDMSTGEEKIGARQYMKEEFINKCKTDPEFSEKWKLTIEERVLSIDERKKIYEKEFVGGLEVKNNDWLESKLKTRDIPTKVIKISYNGNTIESYE